MIWQSRRLVAGMITGTILAVISAALLKPVRATETVVHRGEPTQASSHEDAATAAHGVLHVNGEWDLIWKDDQNHFIRVFLSIEQTGQFLKVRARGHQGIEIREYCCTAGKANDHGVRFAIEPRTSKPMTFSGGFVNGMLVGTTDTAVQWMAMPHFE